MAGLKLEIAQEPPFASLEEEALLNLLRTSDCLNRGAQPRGLTCSAIGSRMITAEPDITRLLSRLKALKLIGQRRDSHDRRVVWTVISDSGLELLAKMDPVILEVPKELLGHLNAAQLADLIHLLELARRPSEAPRPPVSCNGNRCPDQERPAARLAV
jgi:DNA-binding MarR family transcriptional regulator